MQSINRPKTNEHPNADSDCVSRSSPAKSEAVPINSIENKDKQSGNVILFAVAKPAHRAAEINFKYPMLECS